MLGERRPDTELVDLCSILIDPRRVWTRVMPVFQEHGLPSDLLQRTTVAAGAGLGYFPFTADGHLIHVGGGTLETLGALDNPRNAYRDGARLQELAGKRVPRHFQGVPGARSTYEQLMGEFERATSGLDPGEFAALLQTIADHRG
jgi:hypothetical protein